MPRTLSDLRAKFRLLAKNLSTSLQDISRSAASDTKAILVHNVQQQGFGEMYSDDFVPSYFLIGKQLNAKGKKYIDKKKGGKNWKGLREAQGLQTRFVDLTYSGFMFKELGVVKTELKGQYTYYSYIGGLTKDAQQKLNWNYERYGNFAQKAIKKRDVSFIAKNASVKTLNVIKNIGL
jgi:hypothetical protein